MPWLPPAGIETFATPTMASSTPAERKITLVMPEMSVNFDSPTQEEREKHKTSVTIS